MRVMDVAIECPNDPEAMGVEFICGVGLLVLIGVVGVVVGGVLVGLGGGAGPPQTSPMGQQSPPGQHLVL